MTQGASKRGRSPVINRSGRKRYEVQRFAPRAEFHNGRNSVPLSKIFSSLFAATRSYLLVIAAAVSSLAPSANAHAIVLSTTPTSNGVLNGPDVEVNLRFNSRVDLRRSRLILMLPDGEQRTLVINEKSAPDSLLSKAKELRAGSYILRWQVLAEDGHITRGEVPFRVR